MALLRKLFGGLSFFFSRKSSDGNLACSSIQEESIQEATWHLTPPSAEEITFCTVAETLMVQMAPAEVEQEHPPQTRERTGRKKERQTYSSTIKLPGATPPAKPKHAWIDVSPAEETEAEEEMIKEEREVEDETPVMEMESVEIVEADLRQERRMKKERKTEYDTPPPAKAKLAWTEMDGDTYKKFTHTKKREDVKRRPERQAKVEDKTEQAADITPAKGKKTRVQKLESSSKISQKSESRMDFFTFIKWQRKRLLKR